MKRTVALLLVLVFACIQLTGIFHHHESPKYKPVVTQKTTPATKNNTYTDVQSCKLCDLLSQHYHQHADLPPLSGLLNTDLVSKTTITVSLLMSDVTCTGFSNKGPPAA